jgi:ABC-2 type transport system permease protein
MNKTFLIIQREYLTRVRKRTFIISTLLFPLLYIGLIFGTGYIASSSRTKLKIAIVDPTNSSVITQAMLADYNKKDSSSSLVLAAEPADQLKEKYIDLGYDGYIELPALSWDKPESQRLVLHARKSYGDGSTAPIERKLNNIWNDIKSEKLGIDATKRTILTDSKLDLKFENDKDKSDVKTAQGIAYACGFLIYFILLIYGSQVMMGVMEEKTNRIAEVLVSSVRPFQMMLGKIIGIGLVALTQFFLWIAFILIIYNVTKNSGNSGGIANALAGGLQDTFAGVNVPFIILCFAFYFLAGFFFYASLYGAIGSAVNEDMREAQSLSFPVTMLVIISIALMSSAIANPTSQVAVWASIIPFSSPIVMMARIPYGVPGTVPWWQLGLSMTLLILGFMFTTWFAAKIYRTGILMYGKKPTWKEMIKWAFRKS